MTDKGPSTDARWSLRPQLDAAPPPSIQALTDSFRAGDSSPIACVQNCLERVWDVDDSLRAWVFVDEDRSRAAAEASAKRYQEAKPLSPIDGIPFGVKDIIDVAGWPTRCGTHFYESIPTSTAPWVKRLEAAGAIPLGKTVTTPFACFDPAGTTNPRRVSHTPGGSSSGSAAAVAGGQVPFALATQTGGSIIRPAAFCGIYGFKPTFDRVSTDGIFPVSSALDTAGWFTRTPEDLSAIMSAIIPDSSRNHAVPKNGRYKFVVWKTMLDALEDAPWIEGYRQIFDQIRSWGFEISYRQLPVDWRECLQHQRVLMVRDLANVHERLWASHRDQYPQGLASLVEEGQGTTSQLRDEAADFQTKLIEIFQQTLAKDEIGLSPSTTGPAPKGLESTGSPLMNSLWTLVGCPAITLPLVRRNEMPLGLQLTTRRGFDRDLLSVARQLTEKASEGGL